MARLNVMLYLWVPVPPFCDKQNPCGSLAEQLSISREAIWETQREVYLQNIWQMFHKNVLIDCQVWKWPCIRITYISSSSCGDVVKTSISHYLSCFQSYHSRSKIIRQPQPSTHNFKGHEVWSWWVTMVVQKQRVLLHSRKFQINEVILWIQWRKFNKRKFLKAITVFFTIDSAHT